MRETKETCDICGNSTKNKPESLSRLCPYMPPDIPFDAERTKQRAGYYLMLKTLRTKECCLDCIREFDKRFEALVEAFLTWYT